MEFERATAEHSRVAAVCLEAISLRTRPHPNLPRVRVRALSDLVDNFVHVSGHPCRDELEQMRPGGLLLMLGGLGDEPWHARLDHRIKSNTPADAVSDLFQGILGQYRNLKILLDTGWSSRGRQESGAALHCPG